MNTGLARSASCALGAPALRAILVLLASAQLAACATGGGGPERRRMIVPSGVARSEFYTPAIEAAGMVFFSGVIGTRQNRELVSGGIEAETRQALQNLERAMDAADVDRDDVVKCTVFLADIRDYDAMNRVYRDFFRNDPPARSAS